VLDLESSSNRFGIVGLQMSISRRDLLVSAGAFSAAFSINRAHSAGYPDRPVRVVVPFAAGGTTDVGARMIATRLSERLSNQFYVENVGGAGGNIGTAQVARAKPDGYTMLIAASSFAVNPSLYEAASYNPISDFSPIGCAFTTLTLISVHPSVPATTFEGLVKLIKSRPATYSYASPGAGTTPHLLGELFRLKFDLDIVHVPFNGAGPSVASALSGHTPILVSSLPAAAPHVREGKLRAIAVTSKSRSDLLKEIPTTAELGFPDVEADIWTGVFMPANTASAIVQKISSEVAKFVKSPDERSKIEALGYEPVGNSSEEFAAQVKSELERWRNVIERAGIPKR
jgi:tripartite-type tricarboxylate transporter receptor subunit TctC